MKFRPQGNSMTPRIKSGQLCTVEPANFDQVNVGDIVLCKVRRSVFLHLVSAKRDRQLQISNNHGFVNGWTTTLYGRLVQVDP